MLPASNRGVGMNICFPDTCLTPPGVPVPYVNIGVHSMAMPFSPTVFISSLPALNLASRVMITSGDEPGVLHPVIKMFGSFLMGCPTVSVNMLPAINLLCPTAGNAMNAPLGAHLVPNAVNVLFNQQGRATGPLSGEDAAALSAAVREARAPSAALLEGEVGHLVVHLFTANLPSRLFDAIRRLKEAGMRSLVLDLRGCPGGELDAAVRLAEQFLEEGQEIARVVDGDGDEVVHCARREGAHRMPLVALVDGETASAAELFAGALQANGRATVVGERTYGKASAQAAVWAMDGSGLHYATVARCLLPGGASLAEGVKPDVLAEGDALAVARRVAAAAQPRI